VFINGKVVTFDGEDRIASAVAVQDDRIALVGSDSDVRAAYPKADRVIDLKGRVLIPGLTDGHAHLDREGLKSVFPSLGGARCIDDILATVAKEVKKKRPGEWIVTMPVGDPPAYWKVAEGLKEGRYPTRWDLDKVSPDNPVYIRPAWGYWNHLLPVVSVANSRALEVAGLTKSSVPAADSIEYDRDEKGKLTGIFREQNFMPVLELTVFGMTPRFTHSHRVQGIRDSMKAYNAFGTTAIFEEHGVSGELIAAYQELNENDELTVRARLSYSPSWADQQGFSNSWLIDKWAGMLRGRGFGDEHLRLMGFFVSPEVTRENKLRAMSAPYTGWAGFNYDTALPKEQLKDVLVAAARLGVRPGGLNGHLLDVYEEVHQIVPIDKQRWIIGHISNISRRDIERIKRLGLVLTTHTNRHLRREGHINLKMKGVDPHHDVVPLRSLIDAGIHVSLATDNVPVSLFHPIWHCVNRVDQYTNEKVAPEQAITRYEALRAATYEGAYLTFDEKLRGSIEVGKRADLAVLSADPLTVPEDDIKDIAADLTVYNGRVVHEVA
jgi:predicted amidohydrolase YtcJ